MILLAADTSTSRGSVALKNGEGRVLSEDLDWTRSHSETLLETVERILNCTGISKKDVQALAVGVGPGAFTGLRVGLATFKAWASASRLPLIPVVSMDAVALPVLRCGGSVAVLADARKGEVYAAYYPSLDDHSLPFRKDEISLIPYEGVEEWMASLHDAGVCLAGTGTAFLEDIETLVGLRCQNDGPGAPRAVHILEIAETLLPLGRTVEPGQLVPCYVRIPDAQKPAPGSMITARPSEGFPGDGA